MADGGVDSGRERSPPIDLRGVCEATDRRLQYAIGRSKSGASRFPRVPGGNLLSYPFGYCSQDLV